MEPSPDITVELDILSLIRKWQTLNGVKRGNFRSYIRFCRRKSRKIRKKHRMQFNHGKKFSADKFKKMFLERDVWASYAQLAFQKKNKVILEEVSPQQAQKMVRDIVRAFLLMIGQLLHFFVWLKGVLFESSN